MSDYIWETFDGLFKSAYRQDKRVEALEQRIADLERRLEEQSGNQVLADSRTHEFALKEAA